MTWYSAMLRFLITIEGVPDRRARSLVLLRADGHEAAFAAALARGRSMEQDYKNGANERVRWQLELVETLDELDAELADGREVYAEPCAWSEISADLTERPEDSRPGGSGV